MKKRKLLPLGIKKRTTTELPALIALEAIGKPWFCEAHLTDLMAVSMVCQVAAEPGSEVHNAACELFELLGREPLEFSQIEPLVVFHQRLGTAPAQRSHPGCDRAPDGAEDGRYAGAVSWAAVRAAGLRTGGVLCQPRHSARNALRFRAC